MRELRVEVPGRTYSVWIGAGLLERAHELLPRPPGAERVAVFADEALADAAAAIEARGESACERLRRGLEPLDLVLHTTGLRGEENKTVASADAAWRWLAEHGFHRNDLVVAFGGGVVGDLAGFVAATFHRGMPWVQVPTTLLAMVDASIGGKTAVDLPAGKNLVGAFHQPGAVLADVTVLETLPDAVFRTGMAEVIKHALIQPGPLLDELLARREAILARDPAVLAPLVADAAAVKVRIVSEDETEQGVRAFLNYGHTLGHALEALGGYRTLTHGEAVSIGMMFVAHLARLLGYADRVQEHRRALDAFGLPTGGALPSFEEASQAWMRDKKYRKGMRFVVLEDRGRPVLVENPPEHVLRTAYEALR